MRVLVPVALIIPIAALVLLEFNLLSVGSDKIVVPVARRYKLSRNNATADNVATADIDISVDYDDDDENDDDDNVIIKSCDQYNGVLI